MFVVCLNLSAAAQKYSNGRPEAILRMDAPGSNSKSHMKRNVGLAWLDLPLSIPKYIEQ
jgi:hypothetical protein